jgi:hypothetical protein
MQIATLIPAYKTQYLVELLNSLRLQTLRSDQIIVSDDSPHGEFRELMNSAPYRPLVEGLNIEFVDGPRRGAYANFQHLVQVWSGRSAFVHVMLDDDVIYPEFYERHMAAHAAGRFSCSVSRRWTASESGQPLRGQPVPAAVAQNAGRMISLGGELIFLTAVLACNNWFGEFSNAVFRADCADLLLQPSLAGVSYAGLWDLGAFVAASLRQPLCHIEDHLGFFRLSAGQNSANLNGPIMKAAHLGYVALAIGGLRTGHVSPAQLAACAWAVLAALNARYDAEADMAVFRGLLSDLGQALTQGDADAADRFVLAWHAFLHTHGL